MFRIRPKEPWVASVLCLGILVLAGTTDRGLAEPRTTIKDMQSAYVRIAKTVSQSVVRVSSTRIIMAGGDADEPFLKRFPFSPFETPQKPRQRGVEMVLGSGFIVSPDGLIITNNHVVKDMKVIHVTLPGNSDYVAKLVAADAASDIALIKIDAKNLPTVRWGDSVKLQIGDIVVAIGNPFGLTGSVTHGIVSATARSNVGIEGYEDFIQTDAPINPGNSGGPLVNVNAEVIGMNTAIMSKSGGSVGIGFAIPSNSAKYVMADLIKYGKVKRRGKIENLIWGFVKSFGSLAHQALLALYRIGDSLNYQFR